MISGKSNGGMLLMYMHTMYILYILVFRGSSSMDHFELRYLTGLQNMVERFTHSPISWFLLFSGTAFTSVPILVKNSELILMIFGISDRYTL